MPVLSTPLEFQHLFRSSNPLSSGEIVHIKTLLEEAISHPEKDAITNTRKVADLQYLLSSVRRIPEDILVIIFELVYYAENKRRETRSFFREYYCCWTTCSLRLLGGVCGKWRFTAQNSCAHLWARVSWIYGTGGRSTRIPDSSALHTLESQIRYSHGLPLDICVSFKMVNPNSAFNLLRKESHRWRSAVIVIDDAGYWGACRNYPEGITLDAPELTELKLKFKSGSYGDDEEVVLPFTLIAPNLRRAEFWYGPMDWFVEPAGFPWEQLTHVTFICGDMNRCTLLIELIQDKVGFLSVLDMYREDDDDEAVRVNRSPPLVFPRLHTLELRHFGEIPGMADCLFELSTAPALRSLTWETYGYVMEGSMVNFLHRSRCRLEHFTFMHDEKQGLAPYISRMLGNMPYLLSLGLGGWSSSSQDRECDELINALSTGPDANRSTCPLLVETHFMGIYRYF